MSWCIEQGDCLEVMAEMEPRSADAIVTDPPYGIGFMGHDWDQPGDFGAIKANGKPAPYASGRKYPGPHVSGREGDAKRMGARRFGGPTGRRHTGGSGVVDAGGAMHAGRYDLSLTANRKFQDWCSAWGAEALRVLKPGGHIVVFGGTRTWHRLTAGLEDAGFEIRDTLVWLFGSGFPKNRDLGDGWGTALKPGFEPIVLARAPCAGSASANYAEFGLGGINVDGCRIPLSRNDEYERNHSGDRGHNGRADGATDFSMGGGHAAGARWPANVIIDDEAAKVLDEQSGELVSGANPTRRGSDKFRDVYGDFGGQEECEPGRGVDVGGASRFYYCAKTSRAERNAGLDGFEPKAITWSSGEQNPGSFQSDGTDPEQRNSHPTVKPIALMRWLTRLVTPRGGVLLDPFTGSGTTGCAAALEGFEFVGIEREADYVRIAEARIGWWERQPAETSMSDLLAAEGNRRKVADTGQGALL